MTIEDADETPRGTVRHADICIGGAGAAGITLARELRDAGLDVVVLESGGEDPDPDTQALYDGDSIGDAYDVSATRLRYFGGTTNHWGGWCRPFDPIDFEARPWTPWSGWPVGRAHLDPFYLRALPLVELPAEDDLFDFERYAAQPDDDVAPLVRSEAITTGVFVFSRPTHFGEAYRADLAAASSVRVVLGANVVNVVPDATGGRITSAEVATLAGNRFRVEARAFVLALGGIENARLLLASQDSSPTGLGNGRDLVGRFFMDHLESVTATLVLRAPPTSLYAPGRRDRRRGLLALAPDVLRAEDLGQVAWSFEPFGFLLGPLADTTTLPAEHVAEVLRGLEGGASDPWALFLRAEPEPNPDSRVTLTSERDTLGMPRVRLDWRLAAADRARIERAHEILARELGRSGGGRLRWDRPGLVPDEEPLGYGAHHMGTTRMHPDPARGVVDADCRVHGLANLYVAGSSVFPTSGGYSNPTLTIVALALRLADHLRSTLT